jgi:UrcA family protein
MSRTTIALAACLTLIAAGAQAAPRETHVLVPTAGFDLTNARDAKVLLGRLEQASLQACGQGSASGMIAQATIKRSDCYRGALGSAVAAAKAPALDLAFAAAYPAQASTQVASAQR